MSETFEISTFKYGLDTRRDALTSIPGTLVALENAYINPGGEVEKRKSFIQQYSVNIYDNVGASISSITRVGYVATVTSNSHDLANGDWVEIRGAAQTDYNGQWVISNVTTNTFDITLVAQPVSPATGAIVFDDLGVHGLGVTDVGLTVFGSALAFGSTPDARAEPVLDSVMPSGVTYQQLRHPSLYNDTTEVYARARHRMVKVIFAENYNGNAFVGAEFGDGRTFLYYDGALVQKSSNGIVMAGRVALADLGVDLDRQVEALGWLSDANVDEGGTAQNGSVILKSPPNDFFSLEASETSTAGQLGVKLVDMNISGTPATKAKAGFQITVNSGTFTVEAPQTSANQNPQVDLCGGAVAALGTATLTCAAIAQAINDLTYVHGYSATSSADIVQVFAPDSFGNFVLNLVVTTTTGTVISSGTVPATGIVSFAANPVTATAIFPNQYAFVIGIASFTPTGTDTFDHFEWDESPVGSIGEIRFSPLGTNKQGCIFSWPTPTTPPGTFGVVTGSIRCRAISIAATVMGTSFLTVQLTYLQTPPA